MTSSHDQYHVWTGTHIVIQSTYPPQIDSAWDIVNVVPHMAYGRQDRAVLSGEFIPNIMDAKVVLDI